MQFTVYFSGGATSTILFKEGIKHPDKKKSVLHLKQEYASDMGGSIYPYVEEEISKKNTKAEIKKAKQLWKATMRSLYPDFTPRLWARDTQRWPQPMLQ